MLSVLDYTFRFVTLLIQDVQVTFTIRVTLVKQTSAFVIEL